MLGVILDADTLAPDDLDMSALLSLPIEWQVYSTTSRDELPKRIAGAHVIMTNKVVLDADALLLAPHCRYIGVLATGTDNVDRAACEKAGIKVSNVEKYGTAAVVQHTLMLMLALSASLKPTIQRVKQGHWSQSPFFCLVDIPMMELCGKHLVIVGSGELGRGVANIAEHFGMRVSFCARPGDDSDNRPHLDSLLPDADVVSLHCLLSEHTENLFDARRFALMKQSALFINTARGGLVDEQALCTALELGQIAGAGLDVLAQEPPPSEHPLLSRQFDNLIVTPHHAWSSQQARQRLVEIAGAHLASFLDGESADDCLA